MPLTIVAHILGPSPLYRPKKPSRFRMYPTITTKEKIEIKS